VLRICAADAKNEKESFHISWRISDGRWGNSSNVKRICCDASATAMTDGMAG